MACDITSPPGSRAPDGEPAGPLPGPEVSEQRVRGRRSRPSRRCVVRVGQRDPQLADEPSLKTDQPRACSPVGADGSPPVVRSPRRGVLWRLLSGVVLLAIGLSGGFTV